MRNSRAQFGSRLPRIVPGRNLIFNQAGRNQDSAEILENNQVGNQVGSPAENGAPSLIIDYFREIKNSAALLAFCCQEIKQIKEIKRGPMPA